MLRSNRCLLVLPLALMFVGVACGDSGSTSCVSAGDAQVCAVSSDGSISFTTSGLEPGSELTIDSDRGEPATYMVGPAGSVGPDGAIGFLSLFAGTEVVFTVAAVAEGGQEFGGEITGTT